VFFSRFWCFSGIYSSFSPLIRLIFSWDVLGVSAYMLFSRCDFPTVLMISGPHLVVFCSMGISWSFLILFVSFVLSFVRSVVLRCSRCSCLFPTAAVHSRLSRFSISSFWSEFSHSFGRLYSPAFSAFHSRSRFPVFVLLHFLGALFVPRSFLRWSHSFSFLLNSISITFILCLSRSCVTYFWSTFYCISIFLSRPAFVTAFHCSIRSWVISPAGLFWCLECTCHCTIPYYLGWCSRSPVVPAVPS